MTLDYLGLQTIHVIGATAIVGLGMGIGFFMLISHFARDPVFFGPLGAVIVAADILFAVASGLVQPISGYLLMRASGLGLGDGWLALSLAFYVAVGLSWLPLVPIQWRMRKLTLETARSGGPPSAAYDRLSRRWFLFACPGFAGVLAILWLMITKPSVF